MTLSIAAISPQTASTSAKASASTGIFALSLAAIAAGPAASGDAPLAAPADAKTKDDDDTRQDDAAGGNGLPVAAPALPDASLFAALLPPVAAPVPLPASGDSAPVVPASFTAIASPTVAPLALPTAPISPDFAAPQPTASIAPTPVAATLPAATAPTVVAMPAPAASTIATTLASATAPIPPVIPSDPQATATPIVPVTAAVPAAGLPIAPSLPTSAPIPPAVVSAIAAVMPQPASYPVANTVPAAPLTDTASATTAPVPNTPVTGTIQIDTRSAPVVALSTVALPTPLQGATATSAIQVFGAAMRAGMVKDPRADAGIDGATGPLAGSATTRADQALAIAATGDAQQAPLDLHREQWPHAMIDRIEALRDSADATSTKIRVVPDALGPIEMSVRKDGDTVHVHFSADQAATRAILTDAQPRLAAIAEQRGLRLGGSTVDAGNAGAGQQQQQAATRRPSAPVSSSPTVTATTADDDDTRIA